MLIFSIYYLEWGTVEKFYESFINSQYAAIKYMLEICTIEARMRLASREKTLISDMKNGTLCNVFYIEGLYG